MKKYFFTLIILIGGMVISHAQSTEITPGSILPNVTTAQRIALASPKNGMLVFHNNTQSYWFRQSGAWVELPKAGSASNYWQLNGLGGNEIKNTNSGGFWSANSVGVGQYDNPLVTAPVSGAGTRLMWIPSRSAFRVGTVSGTHWDKDSIGVFSTAFGYNTNAKGKFASALGYGSTASGFNSTAMGRNTTASGYSSTTMGTSTTASGESSTAMGYATTASVDYSTAMGAYTTASGFYSTAMGFNTTASGQVSTAIGYYTTASGYYSTAMGSYVSTNEKGGSFIIGDESTATVANATEINQFTARFDGGYRLFTWSNLLTGVSLASGGNSWQIISDSTKKENFIAANGEVVLQSVSEMRIGTWNYKKQDPANFRHWGVMAQDFYKHFGKDSFGTIGNDTSIATADFDGVSFAAIKALEARTRDLKMENEDLKSEISTLKQGYELRLAKLENLILVKEKVAVKD